MSTLIVYTANFKINLPLSLIELGSQLLPNCRLSIWLYGFLTYPIATEVCHPLSSAMIMMLTVSVSCKGMCGHLHIFFSIFCGARYQQMEPIANTFERQALLPRQLIDCSILVAKNVVKYIILDCCSNNKDTINSNPVLSDVCTHPKGKGKKMC